MSVVIQVNWIFFLLVCSFSHEGNIQEYNIETVFNYPDSVSESLLQLDFLIDSNLIKNEKFLNQLMISSSLNIVENSNEISHFNCRFLDRKLGNLNNFIFFVEDPEIHSPIKAYRCTDGHSSMKGLILINSLLLENEEFYNINLLNQIFKITNQKYSAKIKKFSDCGKSVFNVYKLECYDYKLRRTTAKYGYVQQSQILGASFDSTISFLYIEFNCFVMSSNSGDCNNYFIDTQSLGKGAICGFDSDNVLRVILGQYFTVTNTSILSLATTLLTDLGPDNSTPEASITVKPSYSTAISAPKVIINGPTTIPANCPLPIIIFDSYGTSGSAFKSFVYSWTSNITTGLTQISDNGYSVAYAVDSSVADFQIKLNATNLFGDYSLESIFVSVNNSQEQLLIDLSPMSETVYYYEQVNIQGKVINTCGNTGAITYHWTFPSEYKSKVNVYKNFLNIAPNTLPAGNYQFSLYATLALSSNNSIVLISNSVSSTITVIESNPVAVMSKTDSEVSLSYSQFTITGSSSYDPNGFTIMNYSWTSSISGLSNNGVSLTVYNSSYATLSWFTVTLTVTNSQGKSSSTSSNFTVISEGYTDISIPFLNQKVPISKPLNIRAAVEMGYNLPISNISLLWSVIDGHLLTIKNPSSIFLIIPEFSLIQGQTYYFQLTGTALNISNSATVEVKVNTGAACSNSILASPSSGIVRKTLFAFSIGGCIDLDGQDYPLYISTYYKTNDHEYLLGLNSKSTIFYFIANTPNKFALNFEVVDSLGDGNSYTSPYVNADSRLRTLDQENFIEIYKIDTQLFDPYMVFNNFLVSFALDPQLLDLIWNDFVEYLQVHSDQFNKLKLTDSILLMLLSDLQKESLNYDRITKYSNFLCGILKNTQHINNEERENIGEIVEKILGYSLETEYLEITQEILSNLLKFSNNPFEMPQIQNTSSYSLYASERFVHDFYKLPILLEKIKINIHGIQSDEYDLAKFEAIYYKNVNGNGAISVNFNVFRKYESHKLNEKLNKIEFPAKAIEVTMPITEGNHFTCSELVQNIWKKDVCEIRSFTNTHMSIIIKKNGIYSLLPQSNTREMLDFTFLMLMCISTILILSLIICLIIKAKKNIATSKNPSKSQGGIETERFGGEEEMEKK